MAADVHLASTFVEALKASGASGVSSDDGGRVNGGVGTGMQKKPRLLIVNDITCGALPYACAGLGTGLSASTSRESAASIISVHTPV